MNSNPVAVSAILYDDSKRILLLSPDGKSNWQVPGGHLPNGKLKEGISHKIDGKLGPLEYVILDVIDAQAFGLDKENLVSMYFLINYKSGKIKPALNLSGYTFTWFTREKITDLEIIRPEQPEILHEAFFLMENHLEQNLSLRKKLL